MDRKIEIRNIELRASSDPNSRKIHGTSIVFNQVSEILITKQGEFRELIKPEAITQELIDNSDIVLLYNHNQDSGVLARSKKGKGSLKIILTPTGVDFEFIAKNSPLGTEVLESVRNGDLSACSFAFRVVAGSDFFTAQADGIPLRTITKIELLKDFSIVVDPAYSQTEVDVRGLIEFKSLGAQGHIGAIGCVGIECKSGNMDNMDNNTGCTCNCACCDKCKCCTKCDIIIAQNQKIIEMIQGMIIEDAVEDAVEAVTEALEPVAVAEPVEAITEADMQEQRDLESLEEYYNKLKISIRSIKIE